MNRIGMAVAVLSLAGAASLASAQNRVNVSSPGSGLRAGSFDGGAFVATRVAGYIGRTGDFGGSATTFLTFCMEYNEHVTLGNTYYATISDGARNGGLGGPNPDPVSVVTAAMYREFRNAGNFGGLGQVNTGAETRSLQRAIWFEEQEISQAEFQADALAVALRNWAINNNDGALHGVRVLNMWTNANGTGNAQDMLTIVPLPPAGWAGLASLGGVIGMGYVRRRKQRA